jgi:hypothetical protein
MVKTLDDLAYIKSGCVTELAFADEYKLPLVPRSVTTLLFGSQFNQPLDVGALPQSLTELTFGHTFNQTIGANILPRSLTSLTFGARFNQPIRSNVLPQSLTRLVFAWKYECGNGFDQLIQAGDLPQ